MIVIYSRRASSDLDKIATYYFEAAGARVVASIESRLEDIIERLSSNPLSAPRVSQRSAVRSVAVVRYPFRIFYRIRGDIIDILHIRHTSRRPEKRFS